MRVAILLFDEVDLMDVGGPFEVFLTASRLQAREGHAATFEVVTVSVDGEPVTAFGGLGLIPHASIDAAGDVDLLVVPGAVAVERVAADTRLIDAVRDAATLAGVTASVCTGAFLLERAGLLDGREATTHWEDVAALAAHHVVAGVRDDVRWVDAGEVVTAAGLSSGIAMALHLVERFADRTLAEATARQIDYAWTETR